MASAAMKSDKVAPGFDDGADEKGLHRRTAFWPPKSDSAFPFSGIKSAGGNVKDVATVPGSYLTPSGGHRGRAQRPPDGPDGLGRTTRDDSRRRKGVKVTGRFRVNKSTAGLSALSIYTTVMTQFKLSSLLVDHTTKGR